MRKLVDLEAVEARATQLVQKAEGDLQRAEGKDRLALRHLFSHLAALEELAVVAATRGDGVPGQLQDELVHREAFRRCAGLVGGLLPPTAYAEDLLDFVDSLRGRMSLAMLNIVAEAWLDTALRHLRSHAVAPELLEQIALDEARHHQRAADRVQPLAPRELASLRNLERRLSAFACSPGWLAPIAHLIGDIPAGKMGQRCVESHQDACAALGTCMGEDARDLLVASRAPAYVEDPPEAVPMSPFQVSISHAARGFPLPEFDRRWVRVSRHLAYAEAQLAQAAGHALSIHPELHRTVGATGQLYQPARILVAIRRPHPEGGFCNVYVSDPQRRTTLQVARLIQRRARRAAERRYPAVPDLRGLEPLLPAPRAAVAVSVATGVGVREGFTSLIPGEGLVASMVLGRFREDGRAHLGGACDHRAWDAPEGSRFLDTVDRFLEELA